ncbi:MAG: Transcriptional regulator, MarR family [Candidatus Peribacteria bacterium]|nr:Transcriptional regulator, MarR family [Candidatus Peribacteria bacterium]
MKKKSYSSSAFLLSQIGAYASMRFAERLGPLDLTPPLAGILRILGQEPDMTQRALADLLGMFPSRLVLLLDELEKRTLVERHSRPNNRRSFALRLTKEGQNTLQNLGRIAQDHEKELCVGLNTSEQETLRELLKKIATYQKIRPRVHPGYRARSVTDTTP